MQRPSTGIVSSAVAIIDRLEDRRLFAAAVPGAIDPTTYFVGDLNGDGFADLATPGQQGVGLRLGNGAGGFAAPVWIDIEHTPARVAAGDVNGDGRLDLVATFGSGDGIIAILIGLRGPNDAPTADPTAIFDDPFFFDVGAAVVGAGPGAGPHVKRTIATAPTLIGDFNGTGGDELVYVDEPRGILIALLLPFASPGGTGVPTGTVTFHNSPFDKGVRVATGDVNGDGRADLVGLDQRGTIHLAIGAGPAGLLGVWDDTDIVHVLSLDGRGPRKRFGSDIVHAFTGGVRVGAVAVGDVNGDGSDDIVALADGRVQAVSVRNVINAQQELIAFEVRPLPVDFGGPSPIPPAVQPGIVIADISGNGSGDLFALVRTKQGILPYIEQSNLYNVLV